MASQPSADAYWQDLSATLKSKLDDFYGHLDAAFEHANQTFEGRLKKVDGPLADLLSNCRNSMVFNHTLSSSQREFCLKLLGQGDQVVRDATSSIQAVSIGTELKAFGKNTETIILAPLFVGASKMVVEALCLCGLLAALLGHDEADAFVRGAKEELWGAIWDPGAGVVTLLKRLYAVASRTLRKDQDAAELLKSLAEFEKLMDQWREVAVQMSNGVRFDAALQQVFK